MIFTFLAKKKFCNVYTFFGGEGGRVAQNSTTIEMKTTYIVLLNKKWHTYTIFYFLFNLLNDFIYKLEETVLIDWKIILNRLQQKNIR